MTVGETVSVAVAAVLDLGAIRESSADGVAVAVSSVVTSISQAVTISVADTNTMSVSSVGGEVSCQSDRGHGGNDEESNLNANSELAF